MSRTRPESIMLTAAADRDTLTASKLEDEQVALKRCRLAVQANDALPSLQGQPVAAGPVDLAPASITFLAVREAGNTGCR
jgi:hypothetical protein